MLLTPANSSVFTVIDVASAMMQMIECTIGVGVSQYSTEVANAIALANKIETCIYKEKARRKRAAIRIQNWFRICGANFETVRRRNILAIVLEAYRRQKSQKNAAATIISRFSRAHRLRHFINVRTPSCISLQRLLLSVC